MRGLILLTGSLIGISLALAGTARAECRPAKLCSAGTCREIQVCTNAEPEQASKTPDEPPSPAPPPKPLETRRFLGRARR